eukprot:6346267-Pyramimonas_sp.AAC.1
MKRGSGSRRIEDRGSTDTRCAVDGLLMVSPYWRILAWFFKDYGKISEGFLKDFLRIRQQGW